MVSLQGRYTERVADFATRTPRDVARHLAIGALDAGLRVRGGHRRALTRPRIQHLYLHHVFDDEEPGFRVLMEDLARDHVFLSYSESVERIWSDRIDAPYLAVSFDDGLRSCLTAGRVLAELGISACFFVVVSMVGEKDFGRVASFCRERLAMPPVELLDWDDLERLLEWGHEVGSHALTHRRLIDLDPEARAEELGASHELLCQRLGSARHFAWPFGRFDAVPSDIVSTTREHGYNSCASAVRGAHTSAAPKEALCLRRDHVLARWPSRHVRYFLARNSLRSSPQTNVLPESAP